MSRISLRSTNNKAVIILIFFILNFTITPLSLYLLALYLIPESSLFNSIKNNINFLFLSIPIIIYFMFTGVYYYRFKIDSYIIKITSYHISSFIRDRTFIDISHEMLVEYTFFNRPFSFNKTVMLKFKKDNGKLVTKRLNFTLIRDKEIKRIGNTLDRIIAQNN